MSSTECDHAIDSGTTISKPSTEPTCNANSNDENNAKSKIDAATNFPVAPLRQVLFRFADHHDMGLLSLGLMAVLISGANQPAQLIVFGRILDAFNSSDKEEVKARIHFFAGMYCLLGLQQIVTNTVQISCFETVAARRMKICRERYLSALIRRPLRFFDTQDCGALASSVLEATSTVARGTGGELTMMLQQILAFVVGLTVAFYLCWELALMVCAGLPLLAMFVAVANSAYARSSSNSDSTLDSAMSLAMESLGGLRAIAAFGQEPVVLERFKRLVQSACCEGIRLGKAKAALEAAVSPIMFVLFGLGLWWGSKLVSDDMEANEYCRYISDTGSLQNPDPDRCVTGGQIMTAFLSILFGFMGLLQALPGMAAVAGARTSMAKVLSVVDAAPDAVSDPDVSQNANQVVNETGAVNGGVEFRDVVFSYPARPQVSILQGLSFVVHPGQTVALVGPSGSGKSTVVSLLERFYDPAAGQLLLDGVDLKSLPLGWLRAQIGLVSQEPVLFNGTIGENIALGKEGRASQNEVEAAAELANANDFIRQFPKGYATPVGDKGMQLSGGQKQRIAIARAVVRNPMILILDEATSALDTASERVVQAALDKLLSAKKSTTLVIAHRLSTVKNSDKIIVLAGGRLAEEGTHVELLQKEGSLYCSMVESQLGGAMAPEDVSIEDQPDESQTRSVNAEKKDASTEASKHEATRKGNPQLTDETEPVVQDLQDGDSKQQSPPVRWIWRLMLPEKWFFLIGLLGAMITGLTMPAIGFLMAEFIVVFFSPDIEEMRSGARKWALVFLAMGAVASIGAAMRQYSFAVVTQRFALRVRERVFESLIRQHIGWFDVSPDRAAGALVGRLSQDSTVIQALTGERASIVVSQVVVIVAGLGVAFSTSWELTLLVFIIVPAIAVPVGIQAKMVAKYAEKAANSTVDAGNRAAEVILNIRTIASFGLEAHTMQKFSDELTLPMKQGIRKGIATGLGTGVAAGIVLFGAAFKYFVGGIFFDEGMVSFADIMRCVLVLIFMAFGMGSVSKDASDKAEAVIAARRVHEVMFAESQIDSMAVNPQAETVKASAPKIVKGQVEFKNVVFCYPARPQVPILKGLNLLTEPGQTIAIVGASGCGKSTVVSLLERFYDPDSGQVLLDGVDIRSVPVHWLRAQIGIVSQEPVLFSGTIAENIALGKGQGVSQSEVEAAAQLANADDFIKQFPEGYATPVGEKGLQLSGGQKQRIAIARAVVRDPVILVLDEATSALDTVSERVVQAALEQLLSSKRRTTLIIAHRLSTIQNADRILVLSDGTVAEEGLHSELIQIEGGLYRSLVAHYEAGEKVSQELPPSEHSSIVGG